MNTFDTIYGDRNTRRKLPPAYRFALLPLSLPRRPACLSPPPSAVRTASALRSDAPRVGRLRSPPSLPCGDLRTASEDACHGCPTTCYASTDPTASGHHSGSCSGSSSSIKYVHRIHEIHSCVSDVCRTPVPRKATTGSACVCLLHSLKRSPFIRCIATNKQTQCRLFHREHGARWGRCYFLTTCTLSLVRCPNAPEISVDIMPLAVEHILDRDYKGQFPSGNAIKI